MYVKVMKVHWKPSERVRPSNYLRDREKLLAYFSQAVQRYAIKVHT
jgi:hypothetical protein